MGNVVWLEWLVMLGTLESGNYKAVFTQMHHFLIILLVAKRWQNELFGGQNEIHLMA